MGYWLLKLGVRREALGFKILVILSYKQCRDAMLCVSTGEICHYAQKLFDA